MPALADIRNEDIRNAVGQRSGGCFRHRRKPDTLRPARTRRTPDTFADALAGAPDARMRTTIDRRTGKKFRWNTVVWADLDGVRVLTPARTTSRTATNLHPDRVRRELLAQLNPGVELPPDRT